MEAIDTLRLEEAIVAFYHQNSQNQAANEWLTNAKGSLQAWTFCFELLQPEKNELIKFFGASTLSHKLKWHFHEVASENRLELLENIQQAIIRSVDGPKTVLDSLCVALGVYILQAQEMCPNVIEDFIKDFQDRQIPNMSRDVKLGIMFQVLYAITDEVNRVYTIFQRKVIFKTMWEHVDLVFQSAEKFLGMLRPWNAEACIPLNMAVVCVREWRTHVGLSLEKCFSMASALLYNAEKCLHFGDNISPEETELAINCLTTLQSIVLEPNVDCSTTATYDLAKQFFDAKLKSSNLEMEKEIYCLLAALSMRRLSIIVHYSKFDCRFSPLLHRIVKALLECTEKEGYYPVDEKCSCEALSFWNLFQSNAHKYIQWEASTERSDYIKGLYSQLTRILVRKSMQPDEKSLGQWTSIDLQDFETYRREISKTLVCCHKMLNDEMLEILAEVLDEAIAEFQTDPTLWNRLEASVYSFRSVVERVGDKQSKKIAKLLRVLSEIPQQSINSKLLGTALETVGACRDWLMINPSHLPLAIHLLVGGLNSSMAAEAALALKELCEDYTPLLKPYTKPLLEALHASISTGNLTESTSKEVMLNIGRLLCMLPTAEVPRLFHLIVGPYFDELQAICRDKNRTVEARMCTINRLNMISPLLETDLPEAQSGEYPFVHPLLQILQSKMPIFRIIVDLWVQDVDVLKAACSAMSQAIINLRHQFLPMFPELCQLIEACFQAPCCEGNLGIAKTAIIVFYNNKDCRPVMQQLLHQFILHGFRVFENTPEENLFDIAETFEIFFSSLAKIVKMVPQILEDQSLPIERLIFYTHKGMMLTDGGAIQGTTLFLGNLMTRSKKYAHITEIIKATIEQIVWTLLMCVCQLTPPSEVEKFADVFLALNRNYEDEVTRCVFPLIELPDFPNPNLRRHHRILYTTEVIHARDKDDLLIYLTEMANRSRGVEKSIQ